MIITSQVVARCEVDAFVLERPGALESVAQELESAVIAEGENAGAFIRRDAGSVWVERGHRDLSTMRQTMFGVWAPDPMLGVELQGGPYDGDMKPLRREPDGMPLEFLVLPAPMTGPSFGPSDFEEVLGFPVDVPVHPRYRREGKNGETDRWVYVLDA